MRSSSTDSRTSRRGIRVLGAFALSLALVGGGILVLASSGRESLPIPPRGDSDLLKEAKVAFVDGDFARAEKNLRTLSGNDARILLGRVLLERGRCDEASRIFGALLKEDPRSFEATCGLATASGRLGQGDLAVASWRRATELRSTDARVWRELALGQREKGDSLGALSSAQRSLALDPDEGDLSGLLTELALGGANPSRAPGGAGRGTWPFVPGLPGPSDPSGILPVQRPGSPDREVSWPLARPR